MDVEDRTDSRNSCFLVDKLKRLAQDQALPDKHLILTRQDPAYTEPLASATHVSTTHKNGTVRVKLNGAALGRSEHQDAIAGYIAGRIATEHARTRMHYNKAVQLELEHLMAEGYHAMFAHQHLHNNIDDAAAQAYASIRKDRMLRAQESAEHSESPYDTDKYGLVAAIEAVDGVHAQNPLTKQLSKLVYCGYQTAADHPKLATNLLRYNTELVAAIKMQETLMKGELHVKKHTPKLPRGNTKLKELAYLLREEYEGMVAHAVRVPTNNRLDVEDDLLRNLGFN